MFQLFEARGTEKWIAQLKNFGLYVKTENLYQNVLISMMGGKAENLLLLLKEVIELADNISVDN